MFRSKDTVKYKGFSIRVEPSPNYGCFKTVVSGPVGRMWCRLTALDSSGVDLTPQEAINASKGLIDNYAARAEQIKKARLR